MIESEHHPRESLGTPLLLKRLGNAVEANIVRARLESAGIPTYLGERDVFSGGDLNAGGRAGVEVYVPSSLLQHALEILESPPEDDAEHVFFEPPPENPGRRIAFRAIVASVIGWLMIFIHPVGVFLALALFVYVLYLSYLALVTSYERDVSSRVRAVAAALVSIVGIGASLFFVGGLLQWF